MMLQIMRRKCLGWTDNDTKILRTMQIESIGVSTAGSDDYQMIDAYKNVHNSA